MVFRSISDASLVRDIKEANTRVVFVAPGVSDVVSKALIACMEMGRVGLVRIVLDADEECCRLGYCDASALKALSDAAMRFDSPVMRQAGLRVGLLMTDDKLLVWSPTPLMFEAPPGAAEHNGMVLTPQILNELPQALGIDPEKPGNVPEIGASAFGAEDVAKVVQAIEAVPPAPFNLARLSRVFSAKFQFIETALRGAELIKREMRLDSLIVNSDAPEALRPLLHTTLQPFSTDADKTVEVGVIVRGALAYRKTGEPMTQPTTQAQIHAYWDALVGQYVVSVPGFGKLIRMTDKASFEDGRDAFEQVLKQWVDGFRSLVKGDHDQRVSKVVDLIVARMERASEKEKLTREDITRLVQKGLENLRVIEPGVKVIYKNITVESTRDQEFLDMLKKNLPEQDLKGWFHIFDAAPMVRPGQR